MYVKTSGIFQVHISLGEKSASMSTVRWVCLCVYQHWIESKAVCAMTLKCESTASGNAL